MYLWYKYPRQFAALGNHHFFPLPPLHCLRLPLNGINFFQLHVCEGWSNVLGRGGDRAGPSGAEVSGEPYWGEGHLNHQNPHPGYNGAKLHSNAPSSGTTQKGWTHRDRERIISFLFSSIKASKQKIKSTLKLSFRSLKDIFEVRNNWVKLLQ